jgi:hypothetical protein
MAKRSGDQSSKHHSVITELLNTVVFPFHSAQDTQTLTIKTFISCIFFYHCTFIHFIAVYDIGERKKVGRLRGEVSGLRQEKQRWI